MAAGAQPAGEADASEEAEQAGGGGSNFLLFNAVPSWLTSMLVHIVLLLILAVMTLPKPNLDRFREIVMGPKEEIEELEDFEEEEFEEFEVEITEITDLAPQMESVEMESQIDSPANDMEAAAMYIELDPLGESTAPRNDLLTTVGA